jgi:predicted amidohydrolase YtcJ
MAEASLWSGGRVFTGRRYVEAILVEDGRVAFVGDRDAAQRQAPTGVEHRALAGRLIIPGLVDAHLHLSDLTRVREGFDLSSTRSLADLRGALRIWAAEHASGAIVGRGWDPERWSDRKWPSLRDVDPVVPDRPVVLHHASGHAALLNTIALEASGALAPGAVADPAEIGRFPDGSPNGLLFEGALRRAASAASDRSAVGTEALERTFRALAAHGLTSIGAMSASPEEIRALRDLDGSGRLPLTVRAFVRLLEIPEFSPDELRGAGRRFAVVGAKSYLDGAFGTRTASLRAPYSDDPATSGMRVGDDRDLGERLADARARGLVLALHAIGDEAVARAVRLLRADASDRGNPGRIEHASLTPPDLIELLSEVGPTLVVQPGFVWSDGWLPDRLGPERCRWAYAFRSLLGRGLRLAGSSDAPYDPVDPWRGIAAAVERRDAAGGSANPDAREALSAEEALLLYTDRAASSLGLVGHGLLEPGAPADLVVLTTTDLNGALRPGVSPVGETWVAGRRVHPGTGARGE